MLRLFAVIIIFGLNASNLLAQHHKIEGHKHDHHKGSHHIKVNDPWSRASVSKNGVVYLTIYNHGNYSENLLGASASVAKKVQLHTHKSENGILRMRHLNSISIPPKSFLHLKPGGHHIMLIGLIKKLKNGNSFPLQLRFEKAGTILVNVNIRHAGALGNHSHHHSLPTTKKHHKH